ncbi:MAG: hypothetical protein [Siphoviridae sp. cttb18]|nr:MAG: hypothetical protein [Siphoviridae sp. cttb18]
MEKSLNKTVSYCGYNGMRFEIDQLLDTKDPIVYHLFLMDGSEHGTSLGGDFTSVAEAKEYAKKYSLET